MDPSYGAWETEEYYGMEGYMVVNSTHCIGGFQTRHILGRPSSASLPKAMRLAVRSYHIFNSLSASRQETQGDISQLVFHALLNRKGEG